MNTKPECFTPEENNIYPLCTGNDMPEFKADAMSEDAKVRQSELRAIEVLENESRCVERRASNKCNGGSDCKDCDLVLTDTEIQWAFAKAIKLLSLPSPRFMKVVHGHKIWKCRNRGGINYYTGVELSTGETHTVQVDERYESNDPYCSECGKLVDNGVGKFCSTCGAVFD